MPHSKTKPAVSSNSQTKLMNQKRAELDNIQLSPEQQQLFEKLEHSNDTFFVTGKAGTGKSLLLQYFRTYTKKNAIVVAPTGVAALNVSGQTIHSLFRLPFSVITKDKLKDLKLESKTSLLLRSLDTIVIDEISMVRADILDAIDYLLRKARLSEFPFGGVQLIMFGDLFQLPPVVESTELHSYFSLAYGGFYCFNADSWKAADPEIVSLSTVFRQTDSQFLELLNAIRDGQPSQELLTRLNRRALFDPPEDGVITLATTNKTVNAINQYRLNQLPCKVYEYKAEITGKLEPSAFPTDEVLQLKVGAQIMMQKNDRDKRWVNGSLGTVYSIAGDDIKVKIDGIIYTVTPETWSKINYSFDRETQKIEEEVVSTFKQLPLRLAWAVTIHKSQGQTYQSVVIDLGYGAFAHGQTYVALSRCTSLETLFLKREVQLRDIIVDSSVTQFSSSN